MYIQVRMVMSLVLALLVSACGSHETPVAVDRQKDCETAFLRGLRDLACQTIRMSHGRADKIEYYGGIESHGLAIEKVGTLAIPESNDTPVVQYHIIMNNDDWCSVREVVYVTEVVTGKNGVEARVLAIEKQGHGWFLLPKVSLESKENLRP